MNRFEVARYGRMDVVHENQRFWWDCVMLGGSAPRTAEPAWMVPLSTWARISFPAARAWDGLEYL